MVCLRNAVDNENSWEVTQMFGRQKHWNAASIELNWICHVYGTHLCKVNGLKYYSTYILVVLFRPWKSISLYGISWKETSKYRMHTVWKRVIWLKFYWHNYSCPDLCLTHCVLYISSSCQGRFNVFLANWIISTYFIYHEDCQAYVIKQNKFSTGLIDNC